MVSISSLPGSLRMSGNPLQLILGYAKQSALTIRSRKAVAFHKIPEPSVWRTTFVRRHSVTSNPYPCNAATERAGLSSSPTGGSCAVSPTSISRHPNPLYTYCTRSSSRRPLPKCPPDRPSLAIIEASSTMNRVFLCRFWFATKLSVSFEKTFWRYIFL